MIFTRPVTVLAILWLVGCAGESEPPGQAGTGSGTLSERAGQARAHLQLGQYAEAIAVCQAELEADSTLAEFLNLMATAYAEDGRYAPAIEALERIVELGSGSVLTYVNLGGINTKLGNFDAAEKHLLHAAALAPSHPEMRRRLAEVYLATNRFGEATQQLEHALQLYPEDATLYYYLGRSLEGAGEETKALDAYEEAMALDIGFAPVCYRAASIARRIGEPDKAAVAMACYQHLQQVGGGDPDAVKQLRKLWDSILEAPEEATHHFRLGMFFSQHGYMEEALSKFDKVARLSPRDADMLNRVAGSLVEHKRPDEALAYYRLALQADPDHFQALINIGSMLSVRELHEEALGHLQRATKLAPDEGRGWYCLGMAQINAGRPQEARQSMQRALDTEPSTRLRERLSQLLASLPAGE
jgi:tetratricopeptide (TPR) repeat protein